MTHEHRGDEVVPHVAERYAGVTDFQVENKSSYGTRWSRMNLEGRSVVWNHRVIISMISRLGTATLLNLHSHNDTGLWTSEYDALGEWGVVWEL